MPIYAMVIPLDQRNDIPKTIPRVRAEVVFGTPSKNCLGTGICKVLPYEAPKNCQCPSSRVVFRKADERTIMMRIRRSDICPTAHRVQFQHEQFTLDESVALPEFVREALALDAQFILSGCYPILQDDRFITVALQLL